MGSRRFGLSEVVRPSAVVVGEAAASESVDEEGLRFGVQGLRLPVRAGALEEGSGLVAAGGRGPGGRGEEASEEDPFGAGAGGGRGPQPGVQLVLFGVVLAAVAAVRAVRQPDARQHAAQEELQGARLRSRQVSWLTKSRGSWLRSSCLPNKTMCF